MQYVKLCVFGNETKTCYDDHGLNLWGSLVSQASDNGPFAKIRTAHELHLSIIWCVLVPFMKAEDPQLGH
jgi:hypothetical protein